MSVSAYLCLTAIVVLFVITNTSDLYIRTDYALGSDSLRHSFACILSCVITLFLVLIEMLEHLATHCCLCYYYWHWSVYCPFYVCVGGCLLLWYPWVMIPYNLIIIISSLSEGRNLPRRWEQQLPSKCNHLLTIC
jgi:hypothetical protein